MQALVYHGPGERTSEDVPDPTIVDPTDAIVRDRLVHHCGTDRTSSRAIRKAIRRPDMSASARAADRRAVVTRFSRHYLPDLVYGANDGIITTFAVVFGVIGAALSERVILILGFANLLADGFSMGASNYSLVARTSRLRSRTIAPTRFATARPRSRGSSLLG